MFTLLKNTLKICLFALILNIKYPTLNITIYSYYCFSKSFLKKYRNFIKKNCLYAELSFLYFKYV